jgi:hypothetical protein
MLPEGTVNKQQVCVNEQQGRVPFAAGIGK